MPAPARYKRELRPAHYILKIGSFSTVSELHKYESSVFEAGGYKWSLSLYPNGDKHTQGSGYISLYLSIEETSNFPPDWKVHVNYKLFVHDKIRDKYLTIQDADGTVRTFNEKKTRWGFSQFLSLKTFQKDSNGYLLHGCCAFGAEVCVLNSTGKEESLTIIKDPPNQKFTWKMKNFSKKDEDEYYSDAFTVGESRWKLNVCPKGYGAQKGKSLSVYLKFLGPNRNVYRECNLRVLDQLNGNHKESKSSRWVNKSDGTRGFPDYMSLQELHKPSKGFIYNDVLIVEVQFLAVSVAKVVGY